MNGTGAGHRLDHDCNGAKYLWAIFPLRDLIIFRQLSKASSRDYDHLILFCFAKDTQHATWPIIEGNKWSNPRGASVIGVVHFHAFLSLN